MENPNTAFRKSPFKHSSHVKRLFPYEISAIFHHADDSLAAAKFPKQFKEEMERLDSFHKELEPLKNEPVRFMANSTYIEYHETYFWFYTFRK